MNTSLIVPFDSQVPDYIRSGGNNDDLSGFSSGAIYTQLSIKGKKFTVVRGSGKTKTHTLVPNPKDPDSPATYIEVVVIKAHPHKSKAYYKGGFKEGGEAAPPDCSSVNGDAPDAGVPNPQATVCALCPNNQWGSKIGPDGQKSKACQDTVRAVIAPIDNVDDLMMLRIPPASIKNLGEFGKACSSRNVAYNMVGTKISFDPTATSAKLVFTPIGLVNQATAAKVREILDTDRVSNIITGKGFPVYEKPAEVEVKKIEAVPPFDPDLKPVETVGSLDLDLDNLSFDD